MHTDSDAYEDKQYLYLTAHASLACALTVKSALDNASADIQLISLQIKRY